MTEAGRAAHPSLALVAIVTIGLALEAIWLLLGTLSAWVTDVPSYTAALTPASQIPWAWLHGVLEAWLGQDRTGLTPPTPITAARVAFISTLALASAGYTLMLAILSRSRTADRSVTGVIFAFAVLFAATACWIPGFVSGDAILYPTFGRLPAVHGIDPYVTSAEWSSLNQVDITWWWFRPTPYPPAWTDLSAVVAALTASLNPTLQVLTYKLLAGGAYVANLLLIWWILPRLAPAAGARNRRLIGTALFGWNPLVVFETGQGHNDTLMATLLLASLVPLVGNRRVRLGVDLARSRVAWLSSLAVLTVAALIKYLPGVVGVFVTVLHLREVPTRNARFGAAALVAGLVCGVTVLVALPWRDSPAVVFAMLDTTAGGRDYVNSIVDIPSFPVVARYLDRLSEHIPQSLALIRFWEHVVVRGLMAIYVAWEIRRVWRIGPTPAALKVALGAALRVSLLTVIFVLTQTLDYYFISPLALAAVLGWDNVWTRVAVAIAVLYLPTFYLRRMDLEPVPNLFLLVALLGPLIGGLIASGRPGSAGQTLPEPAA